MYVAKHITEKFVVIVILLKNITEKKIINNVTINTSIWRVIKLYLKLSNRDEIPKISNKL